VPCLREPALEVKGDLTVSSCDDDAHGAIVPR
jgi:hypothetical protein